MPTPASRAMARIDGSVSAEAKARVAAQSSMSRLRAASARGARTPARASARASASALASIKTDHAPLMLLWSLQVEHSPFSRPRPERRPMETVMTEKSTIRTVRFHEYGEPADVLHLETAPVPAPGPGRVRILVHACGLNPADW